MLFQRNTQSLLVAALTLVTCFAARTSSAQPDKGTDAAPERFDDLVREDFFAGAAGDKVALNRAMKLCQDTLAKNPKHAEAMVWHGSALLSSAGQSFQSGDVTEGIQLWKRGLKQMNDAVALEPENVSVLIPRGATLLPTARYTPDPKEGLQMLKTGVADYEKVLRLQNRYFPKLSVHARGELLFGLADGWYRLGDAKKSRDYLTRITNDLPDSVYAKRATVWLSTNDPKLLAEKSKTLTCTGCHSK
ncbi:MAG: hypothetical protein JWM68_5155 [Verrucomicrobiales bacterium]|nr:hypothetical protein [Verrucomicrobiales bacterium]